MPLNNRDGIESLRYEKFNAQIDVEWHAHPIANHELNSSFFPDLVEKMSFVYPDTPLISKFETRKKTTML